MQLILCFFITFFIILLMNRSIIFHYHNSDCIFPLLTSYWIIIIKNLIFDNFIHSRVCVCVSVWVIIKKLIKYNVELKDGESIEAQKTLWTNLKSRRKARTSVNNKPYM